MGRILDCTKSAGRLLFDIFCEFGDIAIEADFFMSKTGVYRLSHNNPKMHGRTEDFVRSLLRGGYIKQKEKEKFLITPKGRKAIRWMQIQANTADEQQYKGSWIFVIYDIPERMKSERNMFRSFLKRNGFIKLQNSVFVSAFANLDDLDFVRHEYQIEKYVNFIVGKSDEREDDSLLRKKFGLDKNGLKKSNEDKKK